MDVKDKHVALLPLIIIVLVVVLVLKVSFSLLKLLAKAITMAVDSRNKKVA